MNDINENLDQEYPDYKPSSGKQNNKKIAILTIIALIALGLVTVTISATGGKSKKSSKQSDTVATPNYETNYKRKLTRTQTLYQEGGSSLLPKGQEGFDPDAQGPYNDETKVGDYVTAGYEEYGRKQTTSTSTQNVDDQSNYQSQKSSMNSGGNDYSGPVEPPSAVSKDIQNRLDAGYQAEIDHFKSTPKFAWSIDDATYEKLKGGDQISSVETPLKDLYDGASSIKKNLTYTIPAGTRIIATTDQALSTDHPGYFTSTVCRPFDIRGAKLILQGGQNQNDRVPVQPTKLILQDNTEYAIQGQVEMGSFPGLTGHVVNHWPQRIIPSLISAGIGGGAAAYLLNSSTPGSSETNAGNISTRDLIAGPILESSVQGVQNEITRYSKDLPNTVYVKAGEQFSILLTEKLIISR